MIKLRLRCIEFYNTQKFWVTNKNILKIKYYKMLC